MDVRGPAQPRFGRKKLNDLSRCRIFISIENAMSCDMGLARQLLSIVTKCTTNIVIMYTIHIII